MQGGIPIAGVDREGVDVHVSYSGVLVGEIKTPRV